MDPFPDASADPELQLLDGPEDLQGMLVRSRLIALVQAGTVPGWARVFDPATMATITAAEIPGVDQPSSASDAPQPLTEDRPPTVFAPGVEVDGWRCERALGSSSGGTRFRATAVGSHDQVTIMVVEGPNAMDRCRQAAALSAAIDSPFLARVQEATEIGGQAALILASCDGVDIASRIDEGYRFSLHDMRRIARQCGEVLWAACKQGVVHGSLVPECLIWTRRGTICMLDLGLVQDQSSNASPEQAQGAAPDHRSDIYALGAILYGMMSGARITKHHQIQSLGAVRADLPPAIVQAIDRCLQGDPAARYQSVMDLVRDLDDHDDTALAHPGRTRSTVAQLPTPQRPAHAGPLALILLVLVAGLLGGGAYLAWQIVTTPSAQEPGPDDSRAIRPIDRSRPAEPEPVSDPVVTDDDSTDDPTAAAENDPFVVLGHYQTAREAEDWPTAWRAARQVLQRWPHLSADMRLLVPLHIISEPAGATIWIDDQRVGTTPMVWFHDPADNPTISLDAAGHRLAARTAEEASAAHWQWAVTLDPIPGERWRRRFTGPLRGHMAGSQDQVLMIDRHRHLLSYNSTGTLRTLALGGEGRVVGPIVWRRQAFCLIGDMVHGIDLDDFRAAWRVRLDPVPRQVPWLVATEHELMPNRAKLHINDGGATLITLLASRDQGQVLVRNRLQRTISAPVAAIGTGPGSSALITAMGPAAMIYEGATFDQRLTPEQLHSLPMGSGIHHAPLTCWIDRRPHVLLIDDTGSAQLHDLTRRQQAVTRWDLGARAASTPILLKDSSLVIIPLADHRLALLDLQRSAEPTWLTERHPGPLIGPPASAAGRVVYATADGTVTTVATTSGETLWQQHCGTDLASAPVIIDDQIIVTTSNGFVLAIDLLHDVR